MRSERELLEFLEQGLELAQAEWPEWLAALQLESADHQRLQHLLESRTQAAHLNFEFTSSKSVLPGERIGQFEILELIGQGGMGQVFRARRVQGDFDQEVAIKLTTSSASNDALMALFQNERQILASLHHPNIATLYDGGAMQDGTPYVAMEYIHGTPIHSYAKDQALDAQQVLKLFLGVCDGLQAAHSALVIHRDIKPGNILVTPEGVAKILDFGIAKQLQQAGSEPTLAITMTPSYASPEQLRGERLTTASDVYSLGLLLYELMTGTRPIPDDTLTPVQLEREITRGKINKPSARCESARRSRYLKGDLDTLIMVSIAEDPGRRYQTAGDLAADIRRFLEGYPIVAVPRSNGYVFKRFVARNRLSVAMSVSAIAALLAGLLATLWQFQVAQTERDRTQQVNELLESVLLSPSHWSKLTHGNDITLGEDASVMDLWLLLEEKIINRSISDDIKIEVLTTLSESHLDLDRWQDSIRVGQRVLELIDNNESIAGHQRTNILRHLTFARHKSNHVNTGDSYAELLSSEVNTGSLEHAGDLKNYAVWLRQVKRYDEAAKHFGLAIEILESIGHDASTAFALGSAALLDCEQGRVNQCAQRLDRAIALWQTTREPTNPSLHRARAAAHLMLLEQELALEQARIAAAAGERIIPGTLEHFRAVVVLLEALVATRSLIEAGELLPQAQAIEDALLAEDHPERMSLMLQMASLDLAEGHPQQGLKALRRIENLRDPNAGYDFTASKIDYLAALALRETGDRAAARERLNRAHEFRIELLGNDAPATKLLADITD